MRHRVLAADDMQPGTVRAIKLEGVAVAIVRDRIGDFHALRDLCPHQAARLSAGRLEARVNSDRPGTYLLDAKRDILRCPWHGYEFDLDSGRCPADPDGARVRRYSVTVEGGVVYVER